MMDSHRMYQNSTYLLTLEQICFLSGDTFSLCSCKSRRVNSESAMVRAQLALKVNGRWDSDWFIARYAKTHPWLIRSL